ncbi:hypothetical protein HY29_04160 [Hyphomonas beringensis]|uniref:DUF3088 domain-containing protein n=1 Tax=Hyphomonas beringensis TaxID=1280946 RepID=A0A062U768_9PROT|nr:DUF3088 domain-containing protein [Hyphomonas beringensis]KCZ52484.1 hypothetical protein HY29_04160 [Hyphomonas beringensis]
MQKDTLYLLDPHNSDPAYPDAAYYCPDCIIMEGLLVSYPELSEKLEIHRINWARPRMEIVSLLGEDNQGSPVLILSDTGEGLDGVQQHDGHYFINDRNAILHALSRRHGIPAPHP